MTLDLITTFGCLQGIVFIFNLVSVDFRALCVSCQYAHAHALNLYSLQCHITVVREQKGGDQK